jgi:hypothetical protein
LKKSNTRYDYDPNPPPVPPPRASIVGAWLVVIIHIIINFVYGWPI